MAVHPLGAVRALTVTCVPGVLVAVEDAARPVTLLYESRSVSLSPFRSIGTMAVHPLGPTKSFTTIWLPSCAACAAVPAQITTAASGGTTRLDMIVSFVRGIGPMGIARRP